MNTLLFIEKQRFKEVAFYVLLGLLQALFLWGLIQQVILCKPWGSKPASDTALIIINIIVFILLLSFFSITLKTTITRSGIRIRMFPFHLRDKMIRWNDIRELEIVNYNGIKEYLGYGYRYIPRKGWCYTISGNEGIRLTLTNGKKILVGTHKAHEIAQIIEDLINKGIIKLTH